MRSIYEKFTDEEFEALTKHKDELKLSWHDYILRSVNNG